MPTSFNVPQFSIALNETGSRTSPAIPSDSKGYSLTIQQVGWAQSGGAALRVWLDVSYDNEQTWVNLTADTFPDVATPAVVKNSVTIIPANAFRVVAGIDPVKKGVARKLRARYEGVKAVTVSGTIVSL